MLYKTIEIISINDNKYRIKSPDRDDDDVIVDEIYLNVGDRKITCVDNIITTSVERYNNEYFNIHIDNSNGAHISVKKYNN